MKLLIQKNEDGSKVDLAIHARSTGMSRRKIRRLLDEGRVAINGKKIRFASYRVRAGDQVTLAMSPQFTTKSSPPPVQMPPEDLKILYEDRDIMAFDKPAGVLSEGRSSERGTPCSTLLDMAKSITPEKLEENLSLRLCHRLDKETSGVIVVAKSPKSCDWVGQQFKHRLTKKVYHALCYGVPTKGSWETTFYLSPISKNSGRVERRFSGGKWSHTAFKVLRSDKELGLSLVECRPTTGRSHQIRIHLELSGFPILGDKKYGSENTACHLPANIAHLSYRRHFLHAKTLSLKPSPEKEAHTIACPYPKDFSQVLRAGNFHDVPH